MAECAFCLQDVADGEEFCPGPGCSGSYRLLFGKPEDAPPPEDERDTLPLDYSQSRCPGVALRTNQQANQASSDNLSDTVALEGGF